MLDEARFELVLEEREGCDEGRNERRGVCVECGQRRIWRGSSDEGGREKGGMEGNTEFKHGGVQNGKSRIGLGFEGENVLKNIRSKHLTQSLQRATSWVREEARK